MKIKFVVALVVSLLMNLLLLWRVFDLDVTTTHLAEENQILDRTLRDLERLLPSAIGTISREHLEGLARSAGIEVHAKEECGLLIGTMYFLFSEGRLSRIELR